MDQQFFTFEFCLNRQNLALVGDRTTIISKCIFKNSHVPAVLFMVSDVFGVSAYQRYWRCYSRAFLHGISENSDGSCWHQFKLSRHDYITFLFRFRFQFILLQLWAVTICFNLNTCSLGMSKYWNIQILIYSRNFSADTFGLKYLVGHQCFGETVT